jgi:hypothetical protein
MPLRKKARDTQPIKRMEMKICMPSMSDLVTKQVAMKRSCCINSRGGGGGGLPFLKKK